MTGRVVEGKAHWVPDVAPPREDVSVGEALRVVAADRPDSVGLVGGDPAVGPLRRWTFSEMLSESESVARGLLRRFSPGERVAMWADNIPEWVLVEFGAALAGITLVTVNPALLIDEARHVIGQSGCVGILHVDGYRDNDISAMVKKLGITTVRHTLSLEKWDSLTQSGNAQLPAVSPSSPFQIQYTSGTTGSPKGATLSHDGVVRNAWLTGDRMELPRDAVFLNPMPMFHTGGCVLGTLVPLMRRCTQVCMHAFTPSGALDLIETEKAVSAMVVPTMLIGMVEDPSFEARPLSSLKSVLCGGAPVPAALVRRLKATRGIDVEIVFGQTEASPVITQSKPSDTPEDKAETIGTPLPSTEVRIVDPASGTVVSPGEIGELCARGPGVMIGYYGLEDATAAAIDGEGWLHTGDLASMDERGYCRIEGRIKDMIIRGGENIFPREIEAVLFEHPAVAEAAVVGVPDEYWGERVVAFLRPAGSARPSDAELRAAVREKLASFKAPTEWHWVDAFPLTPSGKVKKFELRASLAGR